jgi:hypothetical protein
MIKPELLKSFPARRIKPVDGMAVTAQVWEEAHEYHRQQQRYHALLGHRPGILVGLEVIASQPPGTAVYVLPGLAIGPEGDIIVLSEPTPFDMGTTAEGSFCLYLTYDESRPMAMGNSDEADQPLYIRAEFGLEAGQAPPAAGGLELARVRRSSRMAPIADALDPAHPGSNAIDLRFRPQLPVAPEPVASIAVSYVGGSDCPHGAGLDNLARFAHQGGQMRVSVDDAVPLDGGLPSYALVCVAGLGAFDLTTGQMTALYDYVRQGGTLFLEACRRNVPAGDAPADASFRGLLATLGIPTKDVLPGAALLAEPHFFAAPPAGFEPGATPQVAQGDGVIHSTADYGCLWAGQSRGRAPAREEIRSALEWGTNILAYALARRAKA